MTGRQLLAGLRELPDAVLDLPVTHEDLETYDNELTDVDVTDVAIKLEFRSRA